MPINRCRSNKSEVITIHCPLKERAEVGPEVVEAEMKAKKEEDEVLPTQYHCVLIAKK